MRGRGLAGVLVSALLAMLVIATPASGQDGGDAVRPKAIVGYVGFVDETLDDHLVVGAAARIPILSRWAVEPELLYMRGSALHYDLALQALVVRELGADDRVVPYAVAGGGILLTHSEFPGALEEEFTATTATAGIGLGLDLRLGDRLVISPEARIGWEARVRATVAIGYVLF